MHGVKEHINGTSSRYWNFFIGGIVWREGKRCFLDSYLNNIGPEQNDSSEVRTKTMPCSKCQQISKPISFRLMRKRTAEKEDATWSNLRHSKWWGGGLRWERSLFYYYRRHRPINSQNWQLKYFYEPGIELGNPSTIRCSRCRWRDWKGNHINWGILIITNSRMVLASHWN